jgi:hypothetical protein
VLGDAVGRGAEQVVAKEVAAMAEDDQVVVAGGGALAADADVRGKSGGTLVLQGDAPNLGTFTLNGTSFEIAVDGTWTVDPSSAGRSSGFFELGRRDLNSGPLVPQAYRAVWRALSSGGGKWL